MLDSALHQKLSAHLHLPGDVCVGLLQALVEAFGRERGPKLANEAWIIDLSNWGEFAREVTTLSDAGDAALVMPLCVHLAAELIFQVTRLVAHDEKQNVDLDATDNETIGTLKSAGWEFGNGMPHGNDCLADSLLQLLIMNCVVADVPSAPAPKKACEANRVQLNSSLELRPRNIHGVVAPGAFLQHHRHAEATIMFFLRHIGARSGIPKEGIRIHVHARVQHMCDIIHVCKGLGTSEAPIIDLHVYNWTGRGVDGYHYDPLYRLAAAQVMHIK